MKDVKMFGSTILALAVLFSPCATALAVEVEVTITPERLKLDGGKQSSPWVACHVTMPDEDLAAEVTKDNTLLEGCLSPVRVGVCDPEEPEEPKPGLVVILFDKDDVRDYLNGKTGTVLLTITIVIDGETYEGSDAIKVK